MIHSTRDFTRMLLPRLQYSSTPSTCATPPPPVAHTKRDHSRVLEIKLSHTRTLCSRHTGTVFYFVFQSNQTIPDPIVLVIGIVCIFFPQSLYSTLHWSVLGVVAVAAALLWQIQSSLLIVPQFMCAICGVCTRYPSAGRRGGPSTWHELHIKQETWSWRSHTGTSNASQNRVNQWSVFCLCRKLRKLNGPCHKSHHLFEAHHHRHDHPACHRPRIQGSSTAIFRIRIELAGNPMEGTAMLIDSLRAFCPLPRPRTHTISQSLN